MDGVFSLLDSSELEVFKVILKTLDEYEFAQIVADALAKVLQKTYTVEGKYYLIVSKKYFNWMKSTNVEGTDLSISQFLSNSIPHLIDIRYHDATPENTLILYSQAYEDHPYNCLRVDLDILNQKILK